MESDASCESHFLSFDEEYHGYDIYIEQNPDPYRGGFIWSVCKDCEELETGLNFNPNSALEDAGRFIDNMS